MRKLLAPLILLAALLIASPALADWTGKDAAGATVTFKNPGTCTSVVCVPVAQLYDGTNVVTLTTAGADAASNTLTGLPVYSRGLIFNGSTWDRWTGAVTVSGVATAANQTSGLTKLDTIIANTAGPLPPQSSTVPVGGFSICDGANGTTNPCTTAATVKAASTPAAATDKAIVVDQRPGTVISVNVASGGIASGAIASGALASGSIAAGAQVDLLTMRGTKSAGTAAANSLLAGAVYNSTAPTLTDGQQASLQVGARGGLLIGGGGYPAGATPITISATGTTGATTATLATGASVTTYICGFSIRANATAAATANSTVTGTITGTLNYTQWTAPLASGIGITEQIFTPCIPASAVNTGIAVISAAPGSGGVVSVTAWGFTL